MTQPRPSYQYGSRSGPNSGPQSGQQRLKHPAQGIGLPLTVGATLVVALSLLSADRVSPPLFFLALFLMAVSVVTFGVYLISIVMLRHAKWLAQQADGSDELRAGTDA